MIKTTTQDLLLMDIQNGILERVGADEAYLDRVVAAQNGPSRRDCSSWGRNGTARTAATRSSSRCSPPPKPRGPTLRRLSATSSPCTPARTSSRRLRPTPQGEDPRY